MNHTRFLATLAVATVAVATTCLAHGGNDASAKTWEQLVDKATAYLKSSQDAQGGWSTDKNAGVTGIVLTGLLRCGRTSPDDEIARKALKYIESLVNEKEGHLAGPAPRVALKNYVTSVNVMALSAANKRGEYKTILDNATKFLRKLQWDEEEQKTPKDDFYGGAGYGGTERPDLSNTGMFLEALKAAGIPQDDPAFKKAAIFVSRCQNLKGEHNDQPWADKINDGSFIYTAAKGGETKVPGEHANGALPGYGSMTYTGVKSMIHCGIAKDDPRIKAAVAWMQKNYTLDANPGMPASHSQIGLYYGYHTLAKCFAALDVDTFTDAKGVQHDWRAELIAALAKRQRPDGSWVNEKDAQQWMEGDPHLVTGYALMALSYCKPKPR